MRERPPHYVPRIKRAPIVAQEEETSIDTGAVRRRKTTIALAGTLAVGITGEALASVSAHDHPRIAGIGSLAVIFLVFPAGKLLGDKLTHQLERRRPFLPKKAE